MFAIVLLLLITDSIAINVLCKAWAKNIYHEKNGVRGGSAHFELMID